MPGPLDAYDNSATAKGLTMAPVAPVAPSLEQVWDAARQQTRAIGQTNSTSYYEQPFYEDLADRLNKAGYRYQTDPGLVGASQQVPFGGGTVGTVYDNIGYRIHDAQRTEEQMWAAVEDAHAKGLLKDVPSREAYEKSVGTRMAADNAQAGDVLSRSHGVWGTAAQFLGSAWQGMHDPAQIAIMAASEGVGALAGKLAGAGGTAGRIAAFVAPRASGAGMTSAAAITRATLGSMAREGTVFAVGNAALLPALHANEDRAGVAHDTASDLEQVGQGFLMGAGLGGLGTVAGVATRSIMGRLFPGMPAEMRDFMDRRASEAGTTSLREDLAGAAEGAAASPAVTPRERDSIRHGAGSAIEAEINPYLGAQGAETHGAMLAANRSAMTVGANSPPVVPSNFAAAQTNPIGVFISRLSGVESGGNDAARAPTSSATGRYQFVDKTWMNFYRKAFPGDDASDSVILARRNHGGVQDRVIAVAAREYAHVLQEAGQPVTPGNLYLVHFAGEGGARRLFSAHPEASAEAVLGKAAVKANPFLEGMNAADVIAWAKRRIGTREERAPLPWDNASAPEAMADDGGVAAAQEQVRAVEMEQAQLGAQGDTAIPGPIEDGPTPMPPINPDRVGEHVPDMPALNAPDDRPIYPRMVDTRDLQRSPDFQFRGEIAPGAQPSPHPGAIDVFERKDGSRVIVDGHARVAAAEADGPALVQAHVMREADGWTLPEMQAAAIVRNLIEGGVSEADRARIYDANPKLARMIEGDGYGKRQGTGGVADTGGDVAPGSGAGPMASAGERGGAGAPGDAGRAGAAERAGPVAGAGSVDLNSGGAFSDPAGEGAKAQAEQLSHDWLQKPGAEGGEALPAPPDAVMPDLKALKAQDAFAVNGASLQSIRDVTREIERTDAALAELRACL